MYLYQIVIVYNNLSLIMNIPFLFGGECHIHVMMVNSCNLLKAWQCECFGMECCREMAPRSVDFRRAESVN